jgi:hypothetical protein
LDDSRTGLDIQGFFDSLQDRNGVRRANAGEPEGYETSEAARIKNALDAIGEMISAKLQP